MGLASMVNIGTDQPFSINWDITPIYTFTMFESWGGKDGERIRNNDEKFYYFYVDGWQNPPGLCLMERGVKHAKVLARINAPQELIDSCLADEGRSHTLDKSYAVNSAMREWLVKNIIDTTDASLISLPPEEELQEITATGLPTSINAPVMNRKTSLRNTPGTFEEEEAAALIKGAGFYDSQHNPGGSFTNSLIDNQDDLTVIDQVTGLMWQRGGCDITSIKKVKTYIDELNRNNFGGYNDWRLPTIEEAGSLMEVDTNSNGLHLHPCFSRNQPFIFSADQRRPGGYWFVDYKQGAIFWASGTIPGGFGRACRSV